MADYEPTFGESLPPTMKSWWKEFSNGTHALVRYVIGVLQVNNVDVSDSNPFPITDRWTVATYEDEALDDIDKAMACPTGYEMQILWVHINYLADDTQGTRQIQIAFYTEDTVLIGEVVAGATQGASTQYYYTFAPSLADLAAIRDTDFLMTPMPSETILTAGQILRMYNNAPAVGSSDDMRVYVQYRYRLLA